MKKMDYKAQVSLMAVALVMATGLLVAAPALADNDKGAPEYKSAKMMNGRFRDIPGRGVGRPTLVGKVSVVSGNIITVTGHQNMMGKGTIGTTTYTVDASKAQVFKNNATSSVSNIAVGDNILVQGTVSGTNVTATVIHDGQMRGPVKPRAPNATTTVPVLGNGQPVVAGTVSSTSGNILIITNKSNVQYTVDASNAKVLRGQNVITLAGISTGDVVVVQGTVNGNSVVASTIIDQTKSTSTTGRPRMGIFGGVGQFFRNIFGF